MKKNGFAVLIGLMVVTGIMGIIIGYIAFHKGDKEPILSFGSGAVGYVGYDLVGSRTGTSTTYTSFANNSATTTARQVIGDDVDTLQLNVYANTLDAGGGQNVQLELRGSNDDDCGTTATSTTDSNYDYTRPLTGDIHWYDLGDHLKGLASDAAGVATTSLTWTPISGNGVSFVYEDLLSQCIKLDVSASGTDLWIEAVAK